MSTDDKHGRKKRGSCYVDFGNNYEGPVSSPAQQGEPSHTCQNWESLSLHKNPPLIQKAINQDKKYNNRNWNHNYCRRLRPAFDPTYKGLWCLR